MVDHERRRRRLRPSNPIEAGGKEPAGGNQRAATTGIHDPETGPERRGRFGDQAEERESERGLRSLVGAGSSQVGLGAALRARDAARPTAADLAEAEERLVIVRRNWVPRDGPPPPGR